MNVDSHPLVRLCFALFSVTPLAAHAVCETPVTSADALHTAITNPDCEGAVVEVASGTFVPERERVEGRPRTASFVVTVNDLTLRGAGAENTILSGERGSSDHADNLYTVLRVDDSVSRLTLEDLEVSDGHADPGTVDDPSEQLCLWRRGGAINVCGAHEDSELSLRRVRIADNYGRNAAGIVFWNLDLGLAALVVDTCTFADNLAGTEPSDDAVNGSGFGGGIEATRAYVQVSDSEFLNNRSGFAGGAMEIWRSVAEVRDSTFIDNASQSAGAAFRILAFDPSVVVVDSVIENNLFENNHLRGTDGRGVSFQRGGAVIIEGYANPDHKVVVNGNTFRGNSSVGEGGALDIFNANVEISDNTFEQNRAENSHGGAVSLVTTPVVFVGGVEAPVVHVRDNVFEDNQCAGSGGAIFFQETFLPPEPLASQFEFLDNQFIGNHAAEGGGALALDVELAVVARNSFVGNSAAGVSPITGDPTGNGGALAVLSWSRNAGLFQFAADDFEQRPLTDLVATVIVEDSDFLGNTALFHGGAISDDQAVPEEIFGVNPLSSSSSSALYGPGLAHIEVSGSRFFGNEAEQGHGGAIGMTGEGQHEVYDLDLERRRPWTADTSSPVLPSTLSVTDSTFSYNRAGGEGGALYIYAATESVVSSTGFEGNCAANECIGGAEDGKGCGCSGSGLSANGFWGAALWLCVLGRRRTVPR